MKYKGIFYKSVIIISTDINGILTEWHGKSQFILKTVKAESTPWWMLFSEPATKYHNVGATAKLH